MAVAGVAVVGLVVQGSIGAAVLFALAVAVVASAARVAAASARVPAGEGADGAVDAPEPERQAPGADASTPGRADADRAAAPSVRRPRWVPVVAAVALLGVGAAAVLPGGFVVVLVLVAAAGVLVSARVLRTLGGGDRPAAPSGAASAAAPEPPASAPPDPAAGDGPRFGPASFDGLPHRGPVAHAEVRGRPLELYRVGADGDGGAVAAVRFVAPLPPFRLAYATVDAARLGGTGPGADDALGRAQVEAEPPVRDALAAAGLAGWLTAHAGPEPDDPAPRRAVVRADGSVLVLFHPSGADRAATARLVQMIDDLVEVVERLPPTG